MEKKKKNILIALLIIFAILFFVFIIILPAINSQPVPAKLIICRSHLKYLSLAGYLYHEDNKVWPDQANWCDLLKPYKEGDDSDFQCPADKTGPCSYAMNENIPDDANDLPDDLVLLFEYTTSWNQVGGMDDVVTDRHDRPGANIAFADGHVEFVEAEDISNLRWTLE